MASQLETIKQIHAASPVPFAVADNNFSVIWANEAALLRYSQLTLPSSLALLLSSEQLDAAKIAAEKNRSAFTIPLAAMKNFAASFTPINEGYLISFGFADSTAPMLPQSINYLTGAISSKLRAPLSNIFAGVSSLAQSAEISNNPHLRELTCEINSNSYKILRFSIDFNAYLRYILGGENYFFETVDLCNMLRRFSRASGMLTETIGVPLAANLPENPVFISADENAITYALLHIISNCCRFSRKGNSIKLTLTSDSTNAFITVSDRGLGIPGELLSKICEPFFSYDHFGEPMAGCGLGLSIARHTIASHRGTMAITSREDEGTTVAISIPLQESDDELILKSPTPAADMMRDRFSLMHIILSDSCGTPPP